MIGSQLWEHVLIKVRLSFHLAGRPGRFWFLSPADSIFHLQYLAGSCVCMHYTFEHTHRGTFRFVRCLHFVVCCGLYVRILWWAAALSLRDERHKSRATGAHNKSVVVRHAERAKLDEGSQSLILLKLEFKYANKTLVTRRGMQNGTWEYYVVLRPLIVMGSVACCSDSIVKFNSQLKYKCCLILQIT